MVKRYIEAPDLLQGVTTARSIFLAGGISGCRDWQTGLAEEIIKIRKDLTVLNPRRKNFPMDNPTAAAEQIEWEYDALDRADIISFWFTNETIQPITLFELGRWTHCSVNKLIYVGIEPGYAREQDVRIQMDLVNKYTNYDRIDIVDNIDDLLVRIVDGP